MSKPLSAVWLVTLLGICALLVRELRHEPVPPMVMPDRVTGVTPIDAVQHVVIDNFPAAAAATFTPTAMPWLVPTFAYPSCPARDKELCRIPPVVVTVTAVPIPECTAATMATMVPNTVCVWHAATSTVGAGELWGSVSNDLVAEANNYDHDRVRRDAEQFAATSTAIAEMFR